MKKLADLWEPFGKPEEKKAKCKVCAHYCVISPSKRGFCQTRENIEGKIYSLVYGAGIHRGSNDPIEKKPLYHFWPGSSSFSIATIGCNFRCKHCQNWEISQSFPDQNGVYAEFSQIDKDVAQPFHLTELTPQDVVNNAKKLGSKSIAYTYNEPTIWFEFVRDTSILAKENGIKNVLVTNGYSSKESNAEFVKFIDAANVDIKGFTDSFYKKIVGVPSVQPVLDTCKNYKQNGVHLEITNLIIPNENDNFDDIRKMAKWIRDNLGAETPLHFSAYHPDYRLDQPQTPGLTLKKAWQIAKEEGLLYVYMGNVRSDEGSDTICVKCGEILIERHGYRIIPRNILNDGTCKKCGAQSHIVGQAEAQSGFFF